ncbi:alpha/beta-hydrolase [Thozetella sp. PMI_491]|nr:alpha/beta-hydrolase [Thozetella sp. PMI_491]
MEHAENLGAWGWAVAVTKSTGITLNLGLKAAKGLLGNQRGGASFHEYIAYEGMRDYQSGLKAVEVQNMTIPTSTRCSQFAKKHSIPIRTIKLPEDTLAFWLGAAEARKVVVCFHGGGYMSSALWEHMTMSFGFAEPVDKDVAAVILQYNLAKEDANHYPRQLKQAAWLLDHLTGSERISPRSITLVGDSAGAHLALGLLLHLKHPNPAVARLELDVPLSGAVLISPWVALLSSADSIKTNEREDILSAESLSYWARNFFGGAAPDSWNSPLAAPSEWWSDLPVEKILVTYGDKEMIRDDAAKLCQLLQDHHPRTTAVEFPGEIHAHMLMNRYLHINKACASEKVYVEWLKDHLNT